MNVGFMHAAVVLFMASSLVVTPLYAQNQSQDQTQNQSNAPAPGSAAATTTPPTASTTQAPNQIHMQTPPEYKPPTEQQGPPPAPPREVPLGPHNFSRSWFPNILAPYEGVHVAEPVMTNTPRIEQLIQNGKLMLGLEDAISLGLENNLAIAVERYQPTLDQASLLLAQSGANGPLKFDPTLTSTFSLAQQNSAFNNPFFAGLGTFGPGGVPTETLAPIIYGHAFNADFGYTQNFKTGTQASVTFDMSRDSTSLPSDLFNPYVESTLTVQLTQPLLNGFGKLPNTRYIIEARNTVKIGTSQFRNQVITSVTQIAHDYWELVYAREAVKVEQVTVAADQQLYGNNKKQEEIGTMAPLDVIDAQSQLATDQQALVQSQTTQLLDQTNLLVDITKDPLAAPLQGVEIVPTTPIFSPTPRDISLEDAVAEAMQNRPEIEQAVLNLKNSGIEIKAAKNGLLPQLNLTGEYQAVGYGGIEHKATTATSIVGADLAAPIWDTTLGAPSATLFEPLTQTKLTNAFTFSGGIGDSLSRMIHADAPTFQGTLTLTLPIRNRAAQANYATAEINHRQQEVSYMQTRATIITSVRQALITLEQDRAAVAAAQEARIYNQQSYDDEVKKLQLGTSTAFTVVQKQQLLTVAEGTELRDRTNLIEAELVFEQALGKTLQDHNISIQGAVSGNATQPLNIPGTPDKTLP
ncbi:MAG: TolC family protein [Candidatus Acidiferrales bacterium]